MFCFAVSAIHLIYYSYNVAKSGVKQTKKVTAHPNYNYHYSQGLFPTPPPSQKTIGHSTGISMKTL